LEQVTPACLDLARRLLAHEAGPAQRLAGWQAAESTCQKLCQALGRLVGPAGFQALLQRALFLARPEYPFLPAALGPDGPCFGELAAGVQEQEPARIHEAFVAVFGSFFWLLDTFIGDDLTRRQIRRIWPEVPLGEAGSGAEEREQ
jgi:hypothetical protein